MLRWLNRRNTPEEEETKRRRGFLSRPREEARERTCGDSDSEERRRNEPPSWFLLASARREMKRANACDDPRNATGRSLGRHRKKQAAPMEGPRRVDVTRKDSRPTRLIKRSKKTVCDARDTNGVRGMLKTTPRSHARAHGQLTDARTSPHAILWFGYTPVPQSPGDRRERGKRKPRLGPMSASQPQRPHQSEPRDSQQARGVPGQHDGRSAASTVCPPRSTGRRRSTLACCARPSAAGPVVNL